ncbi:maleylpyruvate isomerase family mycothiol-dependent enzyme [Mycolicibacterium sp. S3B2]|uniref:maleylpyruvate isomerase family mycothiol-dependent enzyme n=1 Tax=Mycolicibacterium sp. S3B2 TaxID=3415120 RepID=UPI003C7D0555
MKPVDHLVSVRRDSHRIAVAAQGRLTATVPSCPGWHVADLVWHVGIVQLFWQLVARGELSGPQQWTEPARPTDDQLLAWFRTGAETAVDALAGLDPERPAWTWGRRHDVGFICRRVAQETAVHGWDALSAVAAEEPIEQCIAADGVDEFLDEVLPGLSPDLAGPAQTVGLCASDVGTDWTIRAGDGAAELTRGSLGADVTVTATASDLLLLLWGRRPADGLQVDGEPAALQRLLARARF